MSQHTSTNRHEEKTVAYTNTFGEEMRVPYTPEEYAWRAYNPAYRNVRIETRTMIVEITTTDWERVEA